MIYIPSKKKLHSLKKMFAFTKKLCLLTKHLRSPEKLCVHLENFENTFVSIQ